MYVCTRHYSNWARVYIIRILIQTYKLLLARKLAWSLVSRPVCAIQVSRVLKPNAKANFRYKLDRWRHIRNPRGRLRTRLLKANSLLSLHFVSRDRSVGFISCMTLTHLFVAMPTKAWSPFEGDLKLGIHYPVYDWICFAKLLVNIRNITAKKILLGIKHPTVSTITTTDTGPHVITNTQTTVKLVFMSLISVPWCLAETASSSMPCAFKFRVLFLRVL